MTHSPMPFSSTTRPRSLESLAPGGQACIDHLALSGGLKTRLAALGLAQGKSIEMIRRASWGGPLHVRVGSTEIILRRKDAALIHLVAEPALAA